MKTAKYYLSNTRYELSMKRKGIPEMWGIPTGWLEHTDQPLEWLAYIVGLAILRDSSRPEVLRYLQFCKTHPERVKISHIDQSVSTD
jgi:hypothetical protein